MHGPRRLGGHSSVERASVRCLPRIANLARQLEHRHRVIHAAVVARDHVEVVEPEPVLVAATAFEHQHCRAIGADVGQRRDACLRERLRVEPRLDALFRQCGITLPFDRRRHGDGPARLPAEAAIVVGHTADRIRRPVP